MNRAERRHQRQMAVKTATVVKPAQSANPSSKQQTLTIQQSLDLAVQHHNAGDLPKAEGIYQQILQADPSQPVALHLLGVIAHQVGKSDLAIELITKALAINLDYAEAHYDLGKVFKELRKLDEALASFHKALGIRPDYVEAHNNLGNALRELGKLDEAVASYHKAIAIRPDYAEAHNNLGLALQDLGKLDEALASFHKALGIRPDYAEAHNNLGLALQDLGKLDEAVASYLKSLSIRPNLAETHYNLGNVLRQLGKLDEAVASYFKALAIKPDFAEAHNNLGNVLKNLGKLDEAVASFHKALAIKPDYAEAHNNLGNVFKKLGKLDEALVEYRQTLELDPSNSSARHMVSALTGDTTETSPKDYVRKLFDDYAPHFDDHLVNSLDYKIPVLMRLAVDRLTNGEGAFKRALDLGCGTGMVAQNFRDVAEEMHGVDLSPRMVEEARRKEVFDALYLEDVIEFLEHPNRGSPKYDLIIAADLFIYIGSLEAVFSAIARVIAVGGMFVFSVEDLEKGDYKLLETGRYSQNTAYIEKLASAHGFSVELRELVVVRNENPGPIAGNLFILRAAASGTDKIARESSLNLRPSGKDLTVSRSN